MSRSKSFLVVCMDVGFSMSNSAPGEDSPFELAKQVIQKFIQRQLFAETKDELALVLFGTEATKNPLAQDGQYQNITVHRNLMAPDFELLEEIENQVCPENQQADWLDALVVCMDLLQTGIKGKRYDQLNIYLLTDLSVEADSEQVDVIVENLKKADITLQFFLPFPVEDNSMDEDGDASGRGPGGPSSGKGLSEEQKMGLEMVKHIMLNLDEEEGLDQIYTFRNAIEGLCMFKQIEKKPMAWPCQLTIGSALSIRIVGYKAVTEEKLKTWLTVDAQSNQKDHVRRETVFCLDDDDETEVVKDDIIQGFNYGSDIVPFSKVDQEQMKYTHDGKCFAVLGFTDQKMVPRHSFMGTQAKKIFAPATDEHAGVALSALVRALDELKMVAIVRYASDRRCNPQIGAAFPCIKLNYECLIYVQLPFMEDLRHYTYASLNSKKFSPSEKQLEAVDSLIDSMMLVDKDADGDLKDLFKVHHTPNPEYQRLFQCLHHRAVRPGTALPPMEPWLAAVLDRPDVIKERCQAPLEQVKKCFTLTAVEKKKPLKTSAQIFGKDSEQPDAKKAKGDTEEEYNLADISEGAVTSVGSCNPGHDFCLLIKQKTIPFQEACEQLTRRIEQLLSNKNTQYYMKSVTYVQTFREQSVKLGKADLFNSYLQSLKGSIASRGLEVFWDLLVQGSISLISQDEVQGSSVSKTEAAQFLQPDEKKDEPTPMVADDDGDVDDLLDNM
ncbi:X-ray repair cross-complementing protein 5-like [Stigmatopora argus]